MTQQQRLKLVQLLGEISIPLLGYFWWNWNFYFIALFYLLDLLASSVFLYVKVKKTCETDRSQQAAYLKNFLLVFALLAVLVSIGLLSMPKLDPDFDFRSESLRFVLLEDMGIAQGFFLVPLVIYAAYMQYKMTFLLPKKYLLITVK